MDDLIGRKALLTELRALDPPGFEDSIAGKVAIKKIKEAPAVSLNPQWIPVTERLPEKDGCYIVHCCDEYASEGIWHEPHVIMEAMFAFGEWSWEETTTEYDITPFVTHWMPLPEPPKEE